MARRRNSESVTLAEAFDGLRADYNASKSSRFRRTRSGVSAIGRSADYHYRSEADYLRMMELSRDFFRNDVVLAQGIRRLVDNVVQEGIKLDPRTGDAGIDAELAARWREWSTDREQCDLAGELNFHAMERLILQQVIVDGDVLVLPNREGPLQLVEAHRLRTPSNTKKNVVHGVLMDEKRRRLEYWLTKDEIEPMRIVSKVSEMTVYKARDAEGRRQVLHIYRPDRVTQTRGVTALAPIADVVGMHDDIQFAKLVQQQLVSCFAIFREREAEFNTPGAQQRGEQTTESLSDGSTRTIEGIAPGMEIMGAPGEHLVGFSPNVPNPEFFPHATLLLTFVAINLGLPVAVLLLDPSQTNFSGWRGAIDQARLGFRELQRWLIDWFHRPVYEFKVRQWVADDALLRELGGEAIMRHAWNPPSWSYIEPLKDASADLLRLRNGLISARRRAAERGIDIDDLQREIIEDNARMIAQAHKQAEELNRQYPGLNVSWREVASLPTPDGVKITIDAASEERNRDEG